ncbi:MAG: hypothetical protein KatS3mg042_1762 [Rhodothermaceae bacterium]|nr:MAG: hypothetical protein KatS3mg042_1762 [Rhodothermaceae bacterium]
MTRPAPRHLALGWTALIVILLTLPGDTLPDATLLEYDKLGHAVLFGVLGWLWMHALPHSLRVRIAGVLAGGAVFAVMSEFYQGLLPWPRTPDALDVVADVIGLIVGVSLYALRTRRPTAMAP